MTADQPCPVCGKLPADYAGKMCKTNECPNWMKTELEYVEARFKFAAAQLQHDSGVTPEMRGVPPVSIHLGRSPRHNAVGVEIEWGRAKRPLAEGERIYRRSWSWWWHLPVKWRCLNGRRELIVSIPAGRRHPGYWRCRRIKLWAC